MSTNLYASMVRTVTERDEGCNLAPSCLNCPFPVCYLDDPQVVRTHIRLLKQRDELEAVEFYRTAVAARKLGVTERTLFRRRARVKDYFNGEAL